jgi:hypothetical protein
MIAKFFKLVAEAPPGPGRVPAAPGGVLSENKARAKDTNNTEELSAKRRRSRSGCNSGGGVLLAGISPTDKVNVESVERLLSGREVVDIRKPFSTREMTGQNLQTIGVFLDLPGTAQPGPFESQVEAADAGEQAAEG